MCWTTPGIEAIGRGSARPSRTKTRQHELPGLERGLGDHAPQRRRRPQPAGPDDGSGRARLARRLRSRAATVDSAARGRLAVGRLGDGLAGLEQRARRVAPKSASASTSASTSGLAARTSTRRPCSSAVLAVAGPITAMIVDGCGLPAMPTRLRTVDDDVNTTASNLPDLIASRTGAGGGVARTVRYAVTSSHSQPRSTRPATRFSVAMSARGRKTRLIGSSSVVVLGPARQQPGRRLPAVIGRRHQVGAQAPGGDRLGGLVTDRGDLQAGEGAGVEAVLLELLAHRLDGVDRGERDPLVAALDQAADGLVHLQRVARRLDRDGRHLLRDGAVAAQADRTARRPGPWCGAPAPASRTAAWSRTTTASRAGRRRRRRR